MAAENLHEIDFYRWAQEQAALLRDCPPGNNPLDIDNLAAEVEDMGRSEVREISSLLRQALAHLVKLAIAPNSSSVAHWFNEIIAFQGDAVIVFSPGLRQRLQLRTIWRVACNGASRSLEFQGIAVPILPTDCPLTIDELLDPELDPREAVKKIAAAIEI